MMKTSLPETYNRATLPHEPSIVLLDSGINVDIQVSHLSLRYTHGKPVIGSVKLRFSHLDEDRKMSFCVVTHQVELLFSNVKNKFIKLFMSILNAISLKELYAGYIICASIK